MLETALESVVAAAGVVRARMYVCNVSGDSVHASSKEARHCAMCPEIRAQLGNQECVCYYHY